MDQAREKYIRLKICLCFFKAPSGCKKGGLLRSRAAKAKENVKKDPEDHISPYARQNRMSKEKYKKEPLLSGQLFFYICTILCKSVTGNERIKL